VHDTFGKLHIEGTDVDLVLVWLVVLDTMSPEELIYIIKSSSQTDDREKCIDRFVQGPKENECNVSEKQPWEGEPEYGKKASLGWVDIRG